MATLSVKEGSDTGMENPGPAVVPRAVYAAAPEKYSWLYTQGSLRRKSIHGVYASVCESIHRADRDVAPAPLATPPADEDRKSIHRYTRALCQACCADGGLRAAL